MEENRGVRPKYAKLTLKKWWLLTCLIITLCLSKEIMSNNPVIEWTGIKSGYYGWNEISMHVA